MTMHHIAGSNGNGTSAIYFDSIPQTYSHLQIRIYGRGQSASTLSNLYSNINTGGYTYSDHNIYGDGSSAGSSSHTGLPYVFFGSTFPAATSLANTYGVTIIDILDYANTSKNKTYKMLSGNDRNGSGVVQLASGLIATTSAITSILFDTEGQFTTGSRLDLYGITSNPIARGA